MAPKGRMRRRFVGVVVVWLAAGVVVAVLVGAKHVVNDVPADAQHYFLEWEVDGSPGASKVEVDRASGVVVVHRSGWSDPVYFFDDGRVLVAAAMIDTVALADGWIVVDHSDLPEVPAFSVGDMDDLASSVAYRGCTTVSPTLRTYLAFLIGAPGRQAARVCNSNNMGDVKQGEGVGIAVEPPAATITEVGSGLAIEVQAALTIED